MIIYSHTYNHAKNEIEITPVEVTETAKTFRAAESILFFCRKVINKNELDTLNTEYGLHMASLLPAPDVFKDKIINYFKEKHRAAEKAAARERENLKKAIQCKIPIAAESEE